MNNVYNNALEALGMTQEEFDNIVFRDRETERKVIEGLDFCLANVKKLENMACILLQYIAERHMELKLNNKLSDKCGDIDKSEKYGIIDASGDDTRDDANNAVAYAMAKEKGINTEGMSPKEVWEAINKKGGVPNKSRQTERSAPKEKEAKRGNEKAPRKIVSATEAEKNHIIGEQYSKEAQKKYDEIRGKEKQITQDCVSLAEATGMEMSGLEYSVKTGSSVADKIERRRKEEREHGRSSSDEEIVADMWDLVRYTGMAKHEELADKTQDVMKKFSEMGYEVVECDNKYMKKGATYKGIHLAVKSPEGQMFEFQIHSPESLRVKNINHILYAESRNVNTSPERKAYLDREMEKNTESLSMPKNIEKLKSFRKEK